MGSQPCRRLRLPGRQGRQRLFEQSKAKAMVKAKAKVKAKVSAKVKAEAKV